MYHFIFIKQNIYVNTLLITYMQLFIILKNRKYRTKNIFKKCHLNLGIFFNENWVNCDKKMVNITDYTRQKG